MKTTEVISTIRWIESLYSEECRESFFTLHTGKKANLLGSEDLSGAFAILTEVSKVVGLLPRKPEAVEVLRAFNLLHLTDLSFAAQLMEIAIGPPGGEEASPSLEMTRRAWLVMTGLTEPISTLTTPEQLKKAETGLSVISLEIRYEKTNPTLVDLSESAELLQELYDAVCRIYRKKDTEPLRVLKIESGSDIRIDCQGLAEIVKHVKDFIFDAWNKLRHKRAEEVLTNNSALLSSLHVLDDLKKQVDKGVIDVEDAGQIRAKMIGSILKMFEKGALLADIPRLETVDNTKLLESFSPKLLEAPKAKAKTASKKPRKKATAKKSPRKKKRSK